MGRISAIQTVLRELGRAVQSARLEVGITQEAAAQRAGIDLKHWQRIERGAINCTMRTLVRVAAALDRSFWELRRLEDSKVTGAGRRRA